MKEYPIEYTHTKGRFKQRHNINLTFKDYKKFCLKIKQGEAKFIRDGLGYTKLYDINIGGRTYQVIYNYQIEMIVTVNQKEYCQENFNKIKIDRKALI